MSFGKRSGPWEGSEGSGWPPGARPPPLLSPTKRSDSEILGTDFLRGSLKLPLEDVELLELMGNSVCLELESVTLPQSDGGCPGLSLP